MIGAIGAGLLNAAIRNEFSLSKTKVKEADDLTPIGIVGLMEKSVESDTESIETIEISDETSLNQALFSDMESFLILAEEQTYRY